MSLDTRRAQVKLVPPVWHTSRARHQKATGGHGSGLLDGFAAATSYHRKYARPAPLLPWRSHHDAGDATQAPNPDPRPLHSRTPATVVTPTGTRASGAWLPRDRPRRPPRGRRGGRFRLRADSHRHVSGWTERVAIPNRGQNCVTAALETVRARLPFALLGGDGDNGTEFLNDQPLRYRQIHELTSVRARPTRVPVEAGWGDGVR